MYKILILLFTIFFFIGCTEKIDQKENLNNNGNENSSDNTTTESNSIKFYNLAELGTIVGGDVIISSRDEQYDFYTTTTNDEGLYPVEPDKLLENIDNNLDTRPTYVLVTVQNGTDIDVNDDGIKDEDGGKPLLGKIKALYKLETITTQGGLAVNLLSTPIAETLQKEETLDEEKFNQTVKNYGTKDINEDGVLNNKDIYQYRMVDDSSDLEDKLRTELLEHIHNDNTVKIQEVTDSLKKEFGIISYNYTMSGDNAIIKLTPSNNLATIQYGINLKSGELFNEVFAYEIELTKNDYVVYKECDGADCGAVNILAYDGSEVKNYFIQSVESNIYDDVNQMNTLRASINEKTKELEEKETTLAEKQEELATVQSEIAEIQNEIDENNSKLTGDYL